MIPAFRILFAISLCLTPGACAGPMSKRENIVSPLAAEISATPAAPERAALESTPSRDDVLVLDVNLRAYRTLDGAELVLDRLQSGASVRDGDRLQLIVTTAHDAHIYVAFCSTTNTQPELEALSVYPPRGAILAKRHQVTFIPGRTKEIVLDDNPGEEVLYLIVTRAQLSQADAPLAQVIEWIQESAHPTDCQKLQRAALPDRRARKPAPGPAAPSVSYAGPDRPTVSRMRGAHVRDRAADGPIRADVSGVVVLRYDLQHHARR